MRTFGLIGYPLEHSFSAGWFRERFAGAGITDAEYLNFPLKDIDGFKALAGDGNICGLNVTAPYKESVIPFLDGLSEDAAAIGAVNCIVRENGRLKGYNTDWQGFRYSLERLTGKDRPSALILGSGGAAKAAAYALRSMGIEHKTVFSSRRDEGFLKYGDLDKDMIGSHRLIINATPLGTYPATDGMPPLPYGLLGPEHYLFDMVYNPAVTRFLEEGRKRGCAVVNGLDMLHRQAELSWKLFGLDDR